MTHSVCAPSVSKWWREWKNKNYSRLHVYKFKRIRQDIVWCTLLHLKCTLATSTTSFHCLFHPTKRGDLDLWPVRRNPAPPDPSSFARCRQAVTASETPPRLVVSIAVIHDPMNAKLGRMFEAFIFGHRIRVVIFFPANWGISVWNCSGCIWWNCSHPSVLPQCLGLWEKLIVTLKAMKSQKGVGFCKWYITFLSNKFTDYIYIYIRLQCTVYVYIKSLSDQTTILPT